MHNLIKPFLVCAIIMGHMSAASIESEVSDVDAVLKRYAGGDSSISESSAAYKAVILDKGISVMPILELLFDSNKDGYYRAAIVEQMFSINGATTEAVRFVEEKTAKPWEEWQESLWVTSALRRLVVVDQDSARMIALRAVEKIDNYGVAVYAIGIIEKIGKQADIEPLENATKGWEDTQRQERQYGAPAVLVSGRKAIAALRTRAGMVEGDARVAKPIVNEGSKAPQLPKPASAELVHNEPGHWRLIAFGVAALVGSLAFVVKLVLRNKRKKHEYN